MNVLLIMVDEMAWWALGHITSGIHTPNIDRLAERSLRFSQAYTPSPICVPTRAAIATGKYLHEIGYWSSAEAYDGRVRSWAHQIRDAGVQTISIGKLHYRNGTDDTGFARQVEPIHIPGGIGWVRGLLRKPMCDYDVTRDLAEDIGAGDTDYHAFDRRVALEAAAWLMQPERKDHDWCAFVSFLSPHYPLIAPAEDFALYDPQMYETDAQPVPDHPILREMWEFWDHDRYFTSRSRGIAQAGYRALCTFVDRQVGRVLDALNASGQDKETLVVFTSDHGDMMGQHGFWVKSVMYDGAARVPLLVSGPSIEPGDRTDPVSLIDIAPTLAAWFGLETGGYSGRNLLAPPDPKRVVLSEYHDGGAPVGLTMMRWDKWKYVHYAEGHPCQLFDLENDPEERVNQALIRPDIASEARSKLYAMMDPEEVNDRAHKDQLARVAALGGRDAVLAMEQWNYTPADSR
jgi:choline-sulfatase